MCEILKKYKNWKFKIPLFAVSLPSLVSFMVKRRTDQRVLQMYNQMSFFWASDMKQKAGKQVCVMVWDLIIPIVTVFTSLKNTTGTCFYSPALSGARRCFNKDEKQRLQHLSRWSRSSDWNRSYLCGETCPHNFLLCEFQIKCLLQGSENRWYHICNFMCVCMYVLLLLCIIIYVCMHACLHIYVNISGLFCFGEAIWYIRKSNY